MSFKNYVNEIIFFVKTIKIKISSINYIINKGVHIDTYFPPSKDKKEWKYYMNLDGERHFTNKDVYVFIIETGEYSVLSKELLAKHEVTKLMLKKDTLFYNQLINKYPSECDYIDGCINPVDKNKAIEADDGTILSYNDTFLMYNEHNIIYELEKFTKGFIHKWFNPSYVLTDELYLQSFLHLLYSNIVIKIINLKIGNINTNRVDKFHMNLFFKSNLGVDKVIDFLSEKDKLWLYKNLKYIMKNTGNNFILEKLSKLLDRNNIGFGELLIGKILDNKDDDKRLYTETHNINKKFGIYSNEVNDIKKTLMMNDKYSYFVDEGVIDDHEIHLEESNKYINGLNANKTKNILLANKKMIEFTKIKDRWQIFNYVLYVVFEKKSSRTIQVVDKGLVNIKEKRLKNSSIPHTLKEKTILLIIIKLLLELRGDVKATFKKIKYSSILLSELKTEGIVLFPSSKTDDSIIRLRQKYKKNINVDNLEALSSNFWDIRHNDKLFFNPYIVDSDIITKSNFSILYNHNTLNGEILVSETEVSIDDLLLAEGYSYSHDGDKIKKLVSFFKLLVGFSIFQDDYTIDDVEKFINKVTSYTIETTVHNRKDIYSSVIRPVSTVSSKLGLLAVTKGSTVGLEPNTTKNKITLRNLVDRISVTDEIVDCNTDCFRLSGKGTSSSSEITVTYC